MANCKAENAGASNSICAKATFAEKHYSPIELSALWGLSIDAIRRLFRYEYGILLIPSRTPHRAVRPNYNTMLIPESVVKRVHAKYSFGKQ